jgi:molybdopterin synthase sulfur carrier subunit|tara:strand:+ start:81 stop:344 length:264 start_codon:yes stop_codon:yes gene_type:complete
MATVFLPYALRKYADGAEQVEVAASTLGELVDNLEAAYPGTKHHLVVDGALKPGLAAIVGHLATRRGLLQKLDPDVEVHFITAISGG